MNVLNLIFSYLHIMTICFIRFVWLLLCHAEQSEASGIIIEFLPSYWTRFVAALRMTSFALLFLQNFHNLLDCYLFVQPAAGGVGRSAAFTAYGFVKFLKQIVGV